MTKDEKKRTEKLIKHWSKEAVKLHDLITKNPNDEVSKGRLDVLRQCRNELDVALVLTGKKR